MMPSMFAGVNPLNTARSSAMAAFLAASTTASRSGSRAPRSTESSSSRGRVNLIEQSLDLSR